MKEKILVWDPVVRVFHWLLLVAFATSYLTGDEETDIHFYSGYLILALLAVRVIWGFVGTEHARFGSFLRPISEAFVYLRGIVSGTSRHYVGHNPAAGWMAVALLVSILITTLSGLTMYGLEGHGPLAVLLSTSTSGEPPAIPAAARQEPDERYAAERRHKGDADDDDDDDDDHDSGGKKGDWRQQGANEHEQGAGEGHKHSEGFWKEIHELFANLTILLIILHVVGVAASSLIHRENLVKSMIDGYKERDADEAGDKPEGSL